MWNHSYIVPDATLRMWLVYLRLISHLHKINFPLMSPGRGKHSPYWNSSTSLSPSHVELPLHTLTCTTVVLHSTIIDVDEGRGTQKSVGISCAKGVVTQSGLVNHWVVKVFPASAATAMAAKTILKSIAACSLRNVLCAFFDCRFKKEKYVQYGHR